MLLLPVRIETRFIDTQVLPQLWVRIYPDHFAVDTHEPEISPDEQAAGETYWEAVWRAGKNNIEGEKGAWRALASALGATRAAWVAANLTPTNPDQRSDQPTPDGQTLTPPPTYPEFATRAGNWERAPLAAALPDHWTVVLYQGGAEVRRKDGSKITPSLAIGPTPKSDLPPWDDEMRWMLDFETALAKGMALQIDISQQERQQGFDRLLVVGRSASGDPTVDSVVLARQIEALHYTAGFAFVPQGAPTNNTPDASSAFDRKDAGYERSFVIERQDTLVPPDECDAREAASALGIDVQLFSHVDSAGRTDHLAAFHMAVALWPATLGYYLEQIMADVFTDTAIEAAREFFLKAVRARGPLPTIRAGTTPYGLLPATSLNGWAPDGATPAERKIHSFLVAARGIWLKSSASTPVIRPGGDPDAQLTGILGMDASSSSFRARYVLGEAFFWNWLDWLGVDDPTRALLRALTSQPGTDLLNLFGFGAWDPRVLRFILAPDSFLVNLSSVQDGPLSETAGLKKEYEPGDGSPGNYLSWLAQATPDDVRFDRYPTGTSPPTLLYRLLRQSLLLEYSSQAFGAAITTGVLSTSETKEAEFVKGNGRPEPGKRWEVLFSPLPGVTRPGQSMADLLYAQTEVTGPYAELGQLRASLNFLAGLPTAELERLLGETLDICSHRLDAWVTAFATAELERQRMRNPNGILLGGYGWIEDIRSRPTLTTARLVPRAEALKRPGTIGAGTAVNDSPPDNAGYIHAPSLSQAASAAVLRNGYLTHRDTTKGQMLAVDLSSRRVRTALSYLEGVRQGQPLGAMLGYEFERRLHEIDRDTYAQAFRDAWPIVANQVTQPPQPAETVAANNVVDGLALERDWVQGKLPPTADWGLGVAAADQTAIVDILKALEDAVDAIGDLATAESVYQLMRGNPGRAGALLDTLSKGLRPPEPEVVNTPRAGIDIVHRVMILFNTAPGPMPSWPAATESQRAAVEPILNAWVATLLPDPTRVLARVSYILDPKLKTGGTVEVSLADLGIAAIDSLTLDAGDTPAAAELEQRLKYVAVLPAGASEPAVVFDRDNTWTATQISFPEFLVLARALRTSLWSARALMPADLAVPEANVAKRGGSVDVAELKTRVDSLLTALNKVASDLDVSATTLLAAGAGTAVADSDDVRLHLLKASFFSPTNAIPGTREGTADAGPNSALAAQAKAVVKELKGRYDKAIQLTGKTSPTVSDYVAAGQLALGKSFPVMPLVVAPDSGPLGQAFGLSPTLIQTDALAPQRWVQQLTLLRPQLSHLDHALGCVSVLAGSQGPRWTIGQLPFDATDTRWLALPFSGAPPGRGRVSIVSMMVGGFVPAQPTGGLLIDEWPERIPLDKQTTGLAFHHEDPTSRAPQCLLLAVANAQQLVWDDDSLLRVVGETLDLARIRSVDLDSITQVGQLLPALYAAFNPKQETVSVDFLSTVEMTTAELQ
jgi:hypothetical protein